MKRIYYSWNSFDNKATNIERRSIVCKKIIYKSYYKSPIGNILLVVRNEKLIGLWIENQKYYRASFKWAFQQTEDNVVINSTKEWLDGYFNGGKLNIDELDIELIESDSRKSIWKILCGIPYGEVVTYNDIAKKLPEKEG